MGNIKRYKVEHVPTFGEIEVQIDFDFVNHIKLENGRKQKYPMDTMIKDLVEFWSGWQDNLKLNKGDYIITFLINLCKKVNRIQSYFNYNLNGVISCFDDEEGWCKLDGSMGIQLLYVFEPEFDSASYVITVL